VSPSARGRAAKKLSDAEYESIDDKSTRTRPRTLASISATESCRRTQPCRRTRRAWRSSHKRSPACGSVCWQALVATNRGPDDDVLDNMLNLEIAQLAAQRVKAQEAIEENGGAILDEKEAQPEESDFRTKFFTVIRENPKCSRRLADRIDQCLRTR
jgi:hypothetical protein